MTVGPIVAGVGYLLLLRMGIEADYWTEVLPGMIMFGLGLAATVAPLTTTVLNSVNEHNAGIASGANNAIARVAGLVAIAALGAVMSAQFDSSIESALGDRARSGETGTVVAEASSRTLAGAREAEGLPSSERATVGPAIEESSQDAFQLGVLLSAGLMIVGGLTSAAWIVNERKRREPRGPIAATAADCGPPCPEEPTEAADREPERVPA
jgi:hypothetical protein